MSFNKQVVLCVSFLFSLSTLITSARQVTDLNFDGQVDRAAYAKNNPNTLFSESQTADTQRQDAVTSAVSAQGKPMVRKIDRIRLAEAFRLGETLGNRVWQNWNKAPFAVLLVTPDYEYLIRHPKPSADFTLLGYDALLKSDVLYRKRTQQANFLATFPAVGGVSTIVIGQAENTSRKTSTSWVVTVLHEHFHQLQDSQAGIYAEIDKLNLARGDTTGMWMLNYTFPYDAPRVKEQFTLLGKRLADALQADGKADFSAKLTVYFKARRELQAMLTPDDYKYLSFQLWKEGIARYTEYQVAKLAAAKYKPSKAFRSLPDYTTFASAAKETMSVIIKELSNLKVEDSQRVAFYPLGAGEGLLLDKVNPQWKVRYFSDKFFVDKYFSVAKTRAQATRASNAVR